MKKWVLIILASVMLMVLSGCSGDYLLTNAKIKDKQTGTEVLKTSTDGNTVKEEKQRYYKVTVEKDESIYNYKVSKYNYDRFEVGSQVDVENHWFNGLTLYPGGSQH